MHIFFPEFRVDSKSGRISLVRQVFTGQETNSHLVKMDLNSPYLIFDAKFKISH